MSPSPVIVWFQRDLRLADNRALSAAIASGRPVVPLYILDEAADGPWALGGAARWWLHGSLDALARALEVCGAMLVLKLGESGAELCKVIAETGADTVHVTRRYEPHAVAREHALAVTLAAEGIAFKRFGGGLLLEPEALATRKGDPFKVFTPFHRALSATLERHKIAAAPRQIRPQAGTITSDRLDDWALRPAQPDWARGLRETWVPGENAARDRLRQFIDGPVADYREARDFPDRPATSRLSPHLAFGELSPRTCWQAASTAFEPGGSAATGAAAFLRELVWREFSHHQLFHFPQLPERPLRPAFERFPWRGDATGLRAWQRGQTGYALVDAGMRELWHSGWMHNRVRMVAASFLVKHLLVPWQEGARWFWDTLVDADLANNSAGWQWVAGSGADAAPYFRIFNPTTQAKKFDPEGHYIRRWLPDRAGEPLPQLHGPRPDALIEHSAARRRALEAFRVVKTEGVGQSAA